MQKNSAHRPPKWIDLDSAAWWIWFSFALLFLVFGFPLATPGQQLCTLQDKTGSACAAVDAARNYVGIPYSDRYRYPSFFSADARISKDIPFRHKYTLRFSVSGFNLTNHFNPLDVHANLSDPQNGVFFGNYVRRFRGDFDVLF